MFPKRVRPLVIGLRQYLTPSVWKHAHQAQRRSRGSRKPTKARWDLQPLVLTLLIMTWGCGESQPERFETAKAFCIVARSKRQRPGKTIEGFQKALARLPFGVLRAVAAGVRQRLLLTLDLFTAHLIVFGCDGSVLECPRTEELERRLDPPVKNKSTPQVWITALVHLRTGVPWAWHFGKGYNRERSHLQALLPTLPARSLIVADAGYNGYELAQAIVARGGSFLIRMGGRDHFYVEKPENAEHFEQETVMLWPNKVHQAKRPPLVGRLFRIRGRKGRDVWLFTNILDDQRLSRDTAKVYYRWRWENEGFFRTYKRTLAKFKLTSRTVKLVHREAEGAMLATQLLLAQGAEALKPWQPKQPKQKKAILPQTESEVIDQPLRCSARRLLLEIRKLLYGHGHKGGSLRQRLAYARREQRQRTSAKVKRTWPRRIEHQPPKPPRFLKLPDKLNSLWHQLKSPLTQTLR